MLRDLSEKLWDGRESVYRMHPFTPLGVLEEVADGVAFASSFANVAAVRSGNALALVDTGGPLGGELALAQVRHWSLAPLELAIYTHGHLDHVEGMARWDAEAVEAKRPRPRVVAHRAVPDRFRRYAKTVGYNACINARQFRVPVRWPTQYRFPDELYDDAHTVALGDQRIELRHARGETDDATWAFLPSQRVLFTGDLFIWAVPNAGNPQKVQRFALDWAEALEQMAALGAEVLCPGHGVPIWGAANVERALRETASLLRHLHDRTLEAMNAGASLDEILHSVRAPKELLERPYLQPVYDEPEFIVRNVWRLYGGWWDGDPASLKPAPARELAAELAQLAGGAAKLAERAKTLAAEGKHALACHLAELAARADAATRPIRAEVYKTRAEKETSLMAQGVYRTASEEK
jgi:alkyl sulfatase BDS1-like metallo-beta-lactamase superfamily hydrolase